MRNVYHGESYNNHTLSYSSKGNQGFFVNILDAIDQRFDCMISRHSKVFFAMFALKYPSGAYSTYPKDNSLVSRFMEAFIRYCRRKGLDPQYVWVREESKTEQVHYHCILLFNGNLIQNGFGIHKKATELWARCLNIENGDGLVHSHFSKNAYSDYFNKEKYRGKKIIRTDPQFEQIYGKSLEAASYLAKCYSKGNAPPYVNEFGCSRIPG